MKKCLVLLTWNEIEAVKVLWDKISADKYDECFVIDPGSDDGTLEFFKEKGATVHIQEKKGRGVAFLLAAEKTSCDMLCFFSPDGNEEPADIDRLFSLIEQGADMAICSRFLPESRNEEDDAKLPFRKWANQTFTWLVNKSFNKSGTYITDTINGFRAFKKEALLGLGLTAEGFAIEFQSTIRGLKKRYVIKEIPTIEGDRIGGESKAKSIPTGLRFVKLYLKELFQKGA